MPKRPGRERNDGKRPDPEHVEEVLDEALDETFPASDPPSVTRPHDLDPERPPRERPA